RRPIDDRCSMTPAVHVAMAEFFRVKQRIGFAQLVDDLRVGVPDLEPAERYQRVGEATVCLYRVQDLLVGHAIAPASDEVVDAIGGRAVDHSGALLQRDELA